VRCRAQACQKNGAPSGGKSQGKYPAHPTFKISEQALGFGLTAARVVKALGIFGSHLGPAAFKDAERHEGRSVPPVCGLYGGL
jgi:hypothetical protein